MTQIRRQKPGRDKPTDNQMLAEVIPEQANFSVSAAWPSKVLYAIPASPSHPPQTVPGSRSQTPSKGWEPQALGAAPQAVTERVLLSVSLSKEAWGAWL